MSPEIQHLRDRRLLLWKQVKIVVAASTSGDRPLTFQEAELLNRLYDRMNDLDNQIGALLAADEAKAELFRGKPYRLTAVPWKGNS